MTARWRKLGKVFDPMEHRLAAGCREFAQSPQALVFDDFVRIYFSTRAVDEKNGKFLSHVTYVDLDKDLRRVRGVAEHPVIGLGGLGCFDEHGIFPLNPLRHGDVVLAYTCGWSRRVSVDVETAVGLAVSRDEGRTFERIGPGPVLAASLHEPMLVGDAFVQVFGGTFHMWYIFGPRWVQPPGGGAPDRVYKIAHATSTDGVSWRREGRRTVPDRLDADECQALPTVVAFEGRYHMWFCYRHATDFRKNPERGYRIGHASSTDLVHWVRDDDELGIGTAPGEWDSEMQCYPHAFHCDGKTWLLYNGNAFGRFGFGAAVLEP